MQFALHDQIAGDGGSQPKIHDIVKPGGQLQKMITDYGRAKGLRTS